MKKKTIYKILICQIKELQKLQKDPISYNHSGEVIAISEQIRKISLTINKLK